MIPEIADIYRKSVKERLAMHAARGPLPIGDDRYIMLKVLSPGLGLPRDIYQQHPVAVLLVLGHQFWDLRTDNHGIHVDLAFDGRRVSLMIEWKSLLAFMDNEGAGITFLPDPPEGETAPPPSEERGDNVVELNPRGSS